MVHIEVRGAFLFVTLDAPATRNALTDAMVNSLHNAVLQAASNPMLRALVIRGSGHTFCAGGDFSRFRELMAAPAGAVDPIIGFNRAFGALLEAIHCAPIATIAVVEGAAFGGGAGLAACCDFVFAAASAEFATPEVTLGLPPAQITPFIVARLGEAAALRLLLSGQRLKSADALACGLADEVLSPDALEPRLAALLAQLRRAEPNAIRATKAIAHQHRQQPLAATLDFAALQFALALRSGKPAEGLAAFAARRQAAWAADGETTGP
jgi:isohexenylglutaconyl-CoA hydratase